ncbi:Rqc2 family fibronectin-binding protein [Fervidobacterium thailandense]|uniref:Rqc2 homolog RqcH n=1 Tax=Fervidobacterium thailandense TaxID=1008305 RepID=A0A1E3G4Z6_9BACT|nr:NFACT family protein [Fervidobacterium thailandense]ODN31345.1 hypothetical protein A4H02_00855 [Fervidobacterium thailandense]
MPFDGFLMNVTVQKIREKILGQSLRNVYLYHQILFFSFDDGDLKISMHPNFSYISWTEHLPMNTEKHSLVELLRNRTRGGRVVEFTSKGYERTAKLVVSKIDELGRLHNYEIYVDIMGKHSNCILVENGTILEAYRRVKTRFRDIFPGEAYKEFPSEKLFPEELRDAETFRKALLSTGTKKLSEALIGIVQGFSRTSAEELLFRADIDDVPVVSLSCEDFRNLHDAYFSLLEEVNRGTLYLYFEREEPIDVAVYRIHKYGDFKECEDLFECLNRYFSFLEQKDVFVQKKNRLVSAVKSRLESLLELQSKLDAELSESSHFDIYRKYGELLKAYSYQISPGQDRVQLLDWETGEQVEVPLEPHLSPIENSMRYFKIYSKMKRKAEGIRERLAELESEINYLQQLLVTIENSENVEELSEIEDEMIETGMISSRGHGRKKTESPKSEPRKYVYNGFTILVGKNNRQNDELVRTSAGNDIWLHAQGIPGAHVIIRTGGKQVDDDTLHFAARLAATYSKGRYSSNVPVDYTFVKNVRKPKGFKPGLVLYTDFKTLFVDPID